MEKGKWTKTKIKCNECGKEFEKSLSLVGKTNYCLECCKKKGLCSYCQRPGLHLH